MPHGVVVFGCVSCLIGRDVHAYEVCFAATHGDVGAFKGTPTASQGFYLVTQQFNTCLEFFEEFKV